MKVYSQNPHFGATFAYKVKSPELAKDIIKTAQSAGITKIEQHSPLDGFSKN